MQNMDNGLTVPKWVLIVWPKICTPNAPKFICPVCLPKPKSSGFQWIKAPLGVRSPLYTSLLWSRFYNSSFSRWRCQSRPRKHPLVDNYRWHQPLKAAIEALRLSQQVSRDITRKKNHKLLLHIPKVSKLIICIEFYKNNSGFLLQIPNRAFVQNIFSALKSIFAIRMIFNPAESLVFCYQNWSDLLWEKIVLYSDWKKNWDHLNNLFKQWKVRTIFGNRILFQLVPGCFSYLIIQNNWNSNWKKLSGFRNMQEKLEK